MRRRLPAAAPRARRRHARPAAAASDRSSNSSISPPSGSSRPSPDGVGLREARAILTTALAAGSCLRAQALEALADRPPRLGEDPVLAEELVLRVRVLHEGVELERQLLRARLLQQLAGLLCLLDRVLEVRQPGPEHVLDAVSDR